MMSGAEPDRRKVGLALSGGAARGLAHIGVLDVLHKEGIPIDVIAGTSAGAVVGAIYAWKRDINPVREYALGTTNWIKIAPLIDPSLFKGGLMKGAKLSNLIASYIGGDTQFSDLEIPFACVATDIDTGEEIVIDSGPVTEALRASISVPGIFTLVKWEGRYLADGGLTTPIPVHVARNIGADFIIAVNVNPPVNERINKKKPEKEPNIFQILLQSIYITTDSLARTSLEEADIVIEPEMAHISAVDFQKSHEAISHGEEAARRNIPDIKRKLGII